MKKARQLTKGKIGAQTTVDKSKLIKKIKKEKRRLRESSEGNDCPRRPSVDGHVRCSAISDSAQGAIGIALDSVEAPQQPISLPMAVKS